MRSMEPFIRSICLTLYVRGRDFPADPDCPLPPGIRMEMHDSRDSLPDDVPGMPAFVEQYRRRFEEGHLLFLARTGGRTVHSIWVARNKLAVDEIQRSLALKETSCCMYNAETMSEFRGRGIYPAVLSRISHWWREQGGDRLYIYTEPGNTTSARGIEKAGMERIGEMSCLRLPGGWRVRKRLSVPEPL